MDHLSNPDEEDLVPESKFVGCETVYESSLCRICLSPGDNLNLFDKSTNQTTVTYLGKIMSCVPSLSISENDPYPNCICNQCCQLLDQAYEFHLLCIQTDHKLRYPMVDVKIEIETKDELDRIVTDENPDPVENTCSKNIKNESPLNIQTRNTDKYSNRSDVKMRKIRKNAAIKDENGRYIRKYKQKPNHKCEICGKMMFGNVALEQHIRTHTGERPFVCEVCGKSFRTRGCIKSHLESHNMNRPKKFNCTLCSYRTHRSIEFKRHAVVHSSDRPFECDICKGKFKSKIILRHHTDRVHLRKFPCHFCEDKFTSNRGLQIHVKIHYSPKQYRCPECKKLYGKFGSLKYHLKQHHPDVKRPKPDEALVEDVTGHKR